MARTKDHVSTDHDLQIFVDRYTKEIAETNAAVFAGAGLSVASGYVDWKNLLRSIAEELRLDIEQEADRLVAVAQYHYNERRNRSTLNQLLIEKFSEGHDVNRNHEILARLPIQTYWTTNYDRMLETALKREGKVVDVKYMVEHLSTTVPRRDAVVYKMHGDIEHPNQAVLTKDDYEKYHLERGPFINLLSGDVLSKTFVFLGFSFSDPNIDYVLARIRATHKDHQREHWCITRSVQPQRGEGKSALEYRRLRQYYLIKDLERFNIRTLLVDSYEDVTALLQRVEQVFRRKTIFISGSAYDYGHWTQSAAENFMAALSAALVQRDRTVVTGFGLGIGSAVVSGALNEILMHQSKRSMSQLVMRPFPIGVQRSEAERRALWTRYRKEMIAYAGVLVVVFGNKEVDGKSGRANGVFEEFQLAMQAGLKAVPVGATGFAAAELHRQVLKDFDKYYPKAHKDLRKCIESLADKKADAKELVARVLKAIDLIHRS